MGGGFCCWVCFAFNSEQFGVSIEQLMEFEQFAVTICLGSVSMPLANDDIEWWIFVPKWIENLILMIIITVFASNEFEADLVPDATLRQMSANPSILALVIIGWVSWFIDVVFLCILKRKKLLRKSLKHFQRSDVESRKASVTNLLMST